MGWIAPGSADPEVDVRLAIVDRVELRVTVGEMQQAAVAEPVDAVVERSALRQIERGRAGDRQSGDGGRRDRLEEFAASHRGITTDSMVDGRLRVHQQRHEI